MGATQGIRPFAGKTDLISKKIAYLVRTGKKTFTLDHFQTRFRKKRLKSDAVYVAGKPNSNVKYIYSTDSRGRIVSAHAHPLKLNPVPGPRPSHYKYPDGKLPEDQAGHLFAHMFGGSDKVDNIVAQSWHNNQIEMRDLERKWEAALNDGSDVFVDIHIEYGPGDRPTGFTIIHTIDDGDPVPTPLYQ